MRALRWTPILAVAIAVVLIVGVVATRVVGTLSGGSAGGYQVRIAMADANQVYAGMPAWIKDLPAGKVTAVSAQGDTAMVTVNLKSAHVPLHAGTEASVVWQSLLGQHYVSLTPGPVTNPALPSGSMIESNDQVTVQDLLNALDAPTRAALAGTIKGLQSSLNGQGDNLNATLQAAGPTVQAVSQILAALDQDGPALNQIVTKLHQVSGVLASRQDDISQTVQNLGTLTSAAASQQTQISQTLAQLPSTLSVAKNTLDIVPGAAKQVDPLLNDLQPAVAQLPETTNHLSPVLTSLQPTLPLLTSTLEAANALLTKTPGLLSDANAVLPGLTQAVTTLQPALAFLRPYTPEFVGGVTDFGAIFATYNQTGHYAQGELDEVGAASVGDLPTGLFQALPGETGNYTPAPGSVVSQPWTDAFGSPAA